MNGGESQFNLKRFILTREALQWLTQFGLNDPNFGDTKPKSTEVICVIREAHGNDCPEEIVRRTLTLTQMSSGAIEVTWI